MAPELRWPRDGLHIVFDCPGSRGGTVYLLLCCIVPPMPPPEFEPVTRAAPARYLSGATEPSGSKATESSGSAIMESETGDTEPSGSAAMEREMFGRMFPDEWRTAREIVWRAKLERPH